MIGSRFSWHSSEGKRCSVLANGNSFADQGREYSLDQMGILIITSSLVSLLPTSVATPSRGERQVTGRPNGLCNQAVYRLRIRAGQSSRCKHRPARLSRARRLLLSAEPIRALNYPSGSPGLEVAVPKQSAIDHAVIGIAEVLRLQEFQVPTYQRPYSWKTQPVSDFWTDLRTALNTKPEYFLGSIVVTTEGAGTRLTIIDGQQRLATTAILLSCIREVYSDRKMAQDAAKVHSDYLASYSLRTKVDEPKLQLSDQDDDFFRKLVIDYSGATTPPVATYESHTRLLAARNYLKPQLKADLDAYGAKWEERLTSWIDFLKEGATVIRIQVPTEADAFLIFETLNARGEDLTPVDLLKNYLFSQAHGRLEAVKKAWIGAVSLFEKPDSNEVVIDFVRHFWCSIKGEAVRERDLYKSMKEQVASEQQAVDFANDLLAAAKLYDALTDSAHEFWDTIGPAGRENVETLFRLGLVQNRPFLLAAMKHLAPGQLKSLLKVLVSASVRGLIVGGIGAGTTEKFYSAAALMVRNGHIKTTADFLTEWKKSALIQPDSVFEPSFAKTRPGSARLARYYLRAIERFESGVAEPEMVPNANEDEVNLEHVLPKSANPTDWPKFPPQEIPDWSARLGNMVLLPKGQNSQLGNKPYAQKRPVFAASKLVTTKMLGLVPDWAPDEVDKRQAWLAARAVKVWPL